MSSADPIARALGRAKLRSTDEPRFVAATFTIYRGGNRGWRSRTMPIERGTDLMQSRTWCFKTFASAHKRSMAVAVPDESD